MSLEQYQGRKYDLLSLRGAKARGNVKLSQSLFDDLVAGEICAGMQKLAQRFVLEFLTEIGSMPFLLLRGCRFMTRVRQGRLRTEADVGAEFQFALVDIRRNLVNEEYDGMPDDERFDTAVLKSIALLGDSLQLHIQVVSVAGDARVTILPIPILP